MERTNREDDKLLEKVEDVVNRLFFKVRNEAIILRERYGG
jgi:hypothetical protein